MRNPGGAILISDPGLPSQVQIDTFTCAHCNCVVQVPPRQDPAKIGGFCYGCTKLVCERCVATGKCDPIEKKLERAEASYHARRSYFT